MDRRMFLGAAGLSVAGTALAVDSAAASERVPGGFTSTFNGSKAGWQNVRGTWTLKPGNLYNRGIAGQRTSVKRTGNFSDVYYRAVVRRRGNSTGIAANALVVNGNPNRLDAQGNWKPCYLFQYANAGWVSVWRFNADGSNVALMSWATSSVPNRTGYNTMEVWTYSDGFMDYHLNGAHIWSGTDLALSFGQVGLSIYTEPGKTSETFLDHASLVDNIGRQSACSQRGTSLRQVGGGSADLAPGG